MNPPAGWAWAEYRLPLTGPTTAGGPPERRGLLISLDGALGEAAPLPGLHEESVDFLISLLSQPLSLPEIPPGETSRELLSQLNSVLDPCGLPPSLRFGLECALVQRAAEWANRTLVEYLWPHGADFSLPTVGLFSGPPEEAAAALDRGDFAACSGVKIKVGRARIDQDARVVEVFRTRWPEAEIRLDANRAFDAAALAELAAAVDALDVAFVEEPFADPADLHRHLQGEEGLPVALDESLVEAVRTGRTPPAGPLVAAWVIKPSLLGLLASLRLIESAGGTAAIVSSSFESPVGLEMLRALAAGSRAAPGLGTDRWFAAVLGPEHVGPWHPITEASS